MKKSASNKNSNAFGLLARVQHSDFVQSAMSSIRSMTGGASLSALAGLCALVGLSAVSTGCIVIADGGGTYNSRPLIIDHELWVGCSWDSYYGQYRWDFQATVSDADGDLDVEQVYVDVIDLYVDPNYPVETWDLAYDGYGYWSNTIYEQYSSALVCEYYYDYEFDFFAIDHSGESDSVTYVP